MLGAVPVVDLLVPRAAQRTFVLTVKDGTGALFDLTGYDAELQVRRSADDDDVLASRTSNPANGITLGGTAGTITIRWTTAETQQFAFSRGVYDLRLLDSTGEATPLMGGSFTAPELISR